MEMKKLIIESIEIINFRSLRNVSLRFNEGYNEIAGANGLGKTTILDAIRYIVFQKNALGKEFNNYKRISKNENDEILPNIKLTLLFDKERILLETRENNWFIDDILQKNKTTYNQTLAQKLDLENLDTLNIRANPDLLSDILVANKQNKNEIRNNLITIINVSLPEEEKIDNTKLDKLLSSVNELKVDIKNKKANIKVANGEIEDYKKNNSDVKNWDIDAAKNNDEMSLSEIEEQINDYEICQDRLSTLNTKIKDIDNKISNIKNKEEQTQSHKSEFKPNILKLILFSIFTFGIYLYFYFKKKDQNNVTQDFKDNNQLIKELEQNKKDFKVEYNQLNNKIQKIDYDALTSKRAVFKNKGIELHDADKKRAILASKIDQKEALKRELETLNDQLVKKNSQLIKISKKTTEVIKEHFPDFDLDLFNSEEKETVAIKEKDIELQFLNYANKMNIVYKINEFLKNRINIQSFDLVDHIESINNISISDDVQIIACRVTRGKILKLNEQDIN